MENIDNATIVSRVTQRRLPGLGLAALVAFIRASIKAVRGRRALIGMDDHMRADIGISRGEALMESRRRFWDLETPPDPTRRPRGD
jgi:uncharacterized protein YjiS (DUF1127 family)